MRRHIEEVGGNKILDPRIIEKIVSETEKIKERIKVAQDRQRSYVNRRSKELEFEG